MCSAAIFLGFKRQGRHRLRVNRFALLSRFIKKKKKKYIHRLLGIMLALAELKREKHAASASESEKLFQGPTFFSHLQFKQLMRCRAKPRKSRWMALMKAMCVYFFCTAWMNTLLLSMAQPVIFTCYCSKKVFTDCMQRVDEEKKKKHFLG